MKDEPKIKLCLHCGKPIKGRVDKKYCDDWCRTYFNNELNSQSIKIIREINSKLRRNRKVLKELLPKDRKSKRIPKIDFLSRGFDFCYSTHSRVSKKGFTFSFCYEFGWLALENEEFLLVRAPE